MWMGLKVLTVLHTKAVNYLDPYNATLHLHLLSCSPSGYTVRACVWILVNPTDRLPVMFVLVAIKKRAYKSNIMFFI